jgi:tellurite methyltransferase
MPDWYERLSAYRRRHPVTLGWMPVLFTDSAQSLPTDKRADRPEVKVEQMRVAHYRISEIENLVTGVYAALRVSVEFFESQFQRQVKTREFELNPFERVALDYVQGDVLDLGCGLGNLALEAARRGCTVTAIDGSPTAIERIRATANEGRLAVDAIQADLTDFKIEPDYDTIVAIGLLMFFRQSPALTLLGDIQAHVRPGGRTIVNVLVLGTTYMEMFTSGNYYLFGRKELAGHFAGWVIELSRFENFPAPSGTLKSFATLIARKPPAPLHA